MINAPRLLADLTRLLKRLEEDLRSRIADVAELKASLQAEWQAARDADRTAETFDSWADQVITQAGVHWLLSCVFLRFIEDNELVERPWLGGTPESGRLALARDRHEAYFRDRPLESDRDYLLASFREAGALPGLHTFFDEAHNPVFRLGISGDAAMALRQFWQQVDPNTGSLVHDFTDADWNTRFLGDLYQDLSEATRKRYALLQTPEFVEEFILDRTLTPAIREFGFREVRMIDPTCGSGHFLLGGFHRLVDEWRHLEPARNPRDIAQRALDAVAGVDLNPFAVAISRFRLLVAALKVSGVHRLTEAPDFKINVAIGDSLLHGKRFGMTATEGMFEGAEHYAGTGLAHAYASEDLAEVQRILGRQYHAVVGNPPYIVVTDAALSSAYRNRYVSCHKQFSLGAPFTERFFMLAVTGTSSSSAGYVGLITTKSFMNREYGEKLVERVLPRLDLTHVVDTSGADIPGHNREGTSTVILFGRHRAPVESTVRVLKAIRPEPTTPSDRAHGLVWTAIKQQIDLPGTQSAYIDSVDVPRSSLRKHPWSIAGGGAADVKALIDARATKTLAGAIEVVGRVTHTGTDEVYFGRPDFWRRLGASPDELVPLIEGPNVRDWVAASQEQVLFPYASDLTPTMPRTVALQRHLWRSKAILKVRREPGGTHEEIGLTWYEWSRFQRERFRNVHSIAYADITTHLHFAFVEGRYVFNRTAPAIKKRQDDSIERFLGLLGLLNSSVVCYWMKQVCFPKDGQASMWDERFAFNASNLVELPIPAELPFDIAKRIESLARELTHALPQFVLTSDPNTPDLPSRSKLDRRRSECARRQDLMVAEQENLDWCCYGLYGLLPEGCSRSELQYADPVEVKLGERAFEIVLARRVAAGIESTSWFERHGSTPITEIPSHWPEDYRQVVRRRIDLIERDSNIGLIERPEYKRRWNTPTWEDMERTALRDWLLDRLESPHLWPAGIDHPPQLTTVNRLADAVRNDAGFMQIAELYAGHSGFDVTQVVAELVAGESVPFLPVLRYTDTGLRKRAQWEDTWVLQRREDAGKKVGKIPVPPKYQSKDFVKTDYWRLRGGLDVPKERWVSYPGCERGADTSLLIAWAGWNHLQQATALAAYTLEVKENEGWDAARLQPLLAGLLELVPWLEQWHNEIDPAYGERMGTYYRGFVNEEARALGFTLDDLRGWKPAAAPVRRRRRTVR
ncbi:MAG: BREX-2 system adenine-specific DNA-methyltransferase PglX [Burkholderiaceae bacterium]|nr:MAG: BREX-2 system adenine-specific DNA-methyltransferase PglX [Burkholderiaceae bacterium]